MKKNAFTIAEMMVVMLLISIITAATLPVMTRRKAATIGTSSSIWKYVDGTGPPNDIYYNEGNTLGAIIGTNTFEQTDNARLLLNTASTGQNHILFKQNSSGTPAKTGILNVDALGNVGLGNVAFDAAVATVTGATAIGSGNTTAAGNSSIAIGDGAKAKAYDIAIGYHALTANTAGSNNIAIGTNACQNVTGSKKICIASLGPSSGTSATDANERIFIGGANSIQTTRYPTYTHTAIMEVHNTPYSPSGNAAVVINSDLIVKGDIIAYMTKNNACWLSQREPGILRSSSLNGNNPSVNVYYYSDSRLKNIKGENVTGLDQVRKLQVFDYTLKKDKKKTPRVGIIAQDLQKIFPNAVTKDEKGYLMVRQEDMFYAMLNSIKQIDSIIQELLSNVKSIEAKIIALADNDQVTSDKIKELELKNTSLEEQNKALEERLQRIEQKIK